MKQQDVDLINSQTQKQDSSSETLESLGLTWLREETDRATEIMLKAFKEQAAMQKISSKSTEEFSKLNIEP